jgi:uncharacterized repeat protein (TIGR03803 family)
MNAHNPVLTRRAIVTAPLLGAGLAAAGLARAGGHGFETVFHFPHGEQPTTRPLATPDAQGRRRLLNIVTARQGWRIPLNGQADADDAFAVHHHAFSSFMLASDGLAYGTRTLSADAICRWDVPKGQVIEDLVRFDPDGSEGDRLSGGLIEGFDGALYGTAESNFRQPGGGTIFRSTTTGELTVLHTFNPFIGEGLDPVGGLTRGADGNYYGVTNQGGEFDPGTLYRMTPDGAVSTLYSFGHGDHDGRLPLNGMTLSPDGLFYGMTTNGGRHIFGTIYSLSHDGVYRKLHSFRPEEGKSPLGTLYAMPDGQLYGTCVGGGAFDQGTAFRFRPERPGRVEVLHHFSGKDGDGALPFAGFELADDGHLYSSTREGGLYGGGTLFRIRP